MLTASATPRLDAEAAQSELARWLAQESAAKARLTQEPGVARPDQWAAKTGLEQMQAILQGALPAPPIAKTLDFLLLEVDAGRAVFQGTPSPAHLNPMGSVHGGWFATLLDSALGCAVHTTLPPGRGYTTAELSVNYVRALLPKVVRVRAEGRVVHAGKQLATAEARLVGPDGTLYAHGTTTCFVFDLPAQAR